MQPTIDIPDFDVSTIMNDKDIYGTLTTENWNIYRQLLERDDYEEISESLYDGSEFGYDFYIIINSKIASDLLKLGYITGEYAWMTNYEEYIANMNRICGIGVRIARQMLEFIAYGKIGNSLLQLVKSYLIDDESEFNQIQMVITELMLKIYENLRIEGLVMFVNQ